MKTETNGAIAKLQLLLNVAFREQAEELKKAHEADTLEFERRLADADAKAESWRAQCEAMRKRAEATEVAPCNPAPAEASRAPVTVAGGVAPAAWRAYPPLSFFLQRPKEFSGVLVIPIAGPAYIELDMGGSVWAAGLKWRTRDDPAPMAMRGCPARVWDDFGRQTIKASPDEIHVAAAWDRWAATRQLPTWNELTSKQKEEFSSAVSPLVDELRNTLSRAETAERCLFDVRSTIQKIEDALSREFAVGVIAAPPVAQASPNEDERRTAAVWDSFAALSHERLWYQRWDYVKPETASNFRKAMAPLLLELDKIKSDNAEASNTALVMSLRLEIIRDAVAATKKARSR